VDDGGVPAALTDGSLVIGGSTRFALEGSAGDLLSAEAALLRLDPEASAVDTVAILRGNARVSSAP